MESNWIKVITNNINLNKNKTEMNKTILRAVILLVAGAVLLCGCEKKDDTPQKKYLPVNNTVVFVPRVIKCKVGDVIKPDIYVDYKKIENPVDYNIKFTPCDPSVLSVNEQCEITSLSSDPTYVSLYCENNGKVYKDTLVVLVTLPSGGDSYYISKGLDLNNDGIMSKYEMSKIEMLDKWYQADASLLKNVKVIMSEINYYAYIDLDYYDEEYDYYYDRPVDFSRNKALRIINLNYINCNSTANHIRLIFSSESVIEGIALTSNSSTCPTIYGFEKLDMPLLTSLSVEKFSIKELNMSNAKNVKNVALSNCHGIRKIDLSECDNLEYLEVVLVDWVPEPQKCDLILSHNIYEKYKNGSPDLTVNINELVNVIEAGK